MKENETQLNEYSTSKARLKEHAMFLTCSTRVMEHVKRKYL